jgi:hypothetical protein
MNPNTKYKFASELPKDYKGTLHFTNFSDEEFSAKWNNVVYSYPPKSTVPIFIPTASPIETFNIRTMFAKQLADREFRKSKRAGTLNEMNKGVQSIHAAVSYTENDLDALISRCLEPLPMGEVRTTDEEPEGKKRPKARVTHPIQEGESLVTGKGETF